MHICWFALFGLLTLKTKIIQLTTDAIFKQSQNHPKIVATAAAMGE